MQTLNGQISALHNDEALTANTVCTWWYSGAVAWSWGQCDEDHSWIELAQNRVQ